MISAAEARLNSKNAVQERSDKTACWIENQLKLIDTFVSKATSLGSFRCSVTVEIKNSIDFESSSIHMEKLCQALRALGYNVDYSSERTTSEISNYSVKLNWEEKK